MNQIQLFLKLTESCNYGCTFCRYANHRRYDDGMSLSQIELLLRDCVRYNMQHGSSCVPVIFHGGEPLLFGLDRFEAIMEIEKQIAEAYPVTFRNNMQSNGELLDEKWCEFLKRNNIRIGLSFDGPGDLNQHKPLGSENSEAGFPRKVRLLNQYEIPFGVLSVITPRHIGREKEFFDYFVTAGVRSLGLCYCYNQEEDCSVDPGALGEFLINLFDICFQSSADLRIREFAEPVRRFLGQPSNYCGETMRCMCGSLMVVTPGGNVSFCDDYSPGREIGNINRQSFDELMEGETRQKMKAEDNAFIEMVCGKCPIRDLCGGGCSRCDLTNGSNYFCETYKMLYPYIHQQVMSILNERNIVSLLKLRRMC